MRKGFWFLGMMLALVSCEKDIEIDLDDKAEALVVEATIENDRPPVVFLSRSLSFYSQVSPEILANSFVRGAEVWVSNGMRRHRLREDSVQNVFGLTIYFYTNDPSSPSTAFLGALKSRYTLEINTGGQTYTAATSIPDITRRIDSVWWEPVEDPEDSNLAKLIIRATDPPGFGNYIRYYTKTNEGPFLPGFNSVFDDQVIDGTTYTFPVDKGFDKNTDIADYEPFFNRGDTVTVKVADIDKTTYDFWRTLEFSYQSVGNPFATPVKVLGNISNGALGYFGGYAAQYHRLVIPGR
jgi:hypothetical protein